jgi:hypothetical protein
MAYRQDGNDQRQPFAQCNSKQRSHEAIMAESVRLSEISRAVSDALASFDNAALERIGAGLQAVVDSRISVEIEPADAIRNNQMVLAGVLMSTEQNLALLMRLQERKATNQWAL